MNDSDSDDQLRTNLIAQDLPSATRASVHQEALFRKVRWRLQVEKRIVGSAYVVVFGIAFLCFMQAGRVQEATKETWWALCSVHLLLWFLVFFLWKVERLVRRIRLADKHAGGSKSEGRIVFVCALAACGLGTAFLGGANFPRAPLKIAEVSRDVLWLPLFFLFWYSFGIATAVGRVWLAFKEMEIRSSASGQPEPPDYGRLPPKEKPE